MKYANKKSFPILNKQENAMNIKHFINWLMPTPAITTAAKLERLEAENDRLQAQVEQCQMALATWATDAESFRIDAEVMKVEPNVKRIKEISN